MKGLSWKYVLLGGLAAGAAMNVIEWGAHYCWQGPNWWLFRAVTTDPIGRAPSYLGYTAGYLLKGCAVMWVYAVARPRFGPGPRTALLVAVTYWVIGYAMPVIDFQALFLDVYRRPMVRLPALVALLETVVGALLGARLYREDDGSRRSAIVSGLALAALAAFVAWSGLAG